MSVASTQPRPSPAPRQAGAGRDERLAGISVVTRLLQRPELGALIGALAVYLLFATVDATPGPQSTLKVDLKSGGASDDS